MRGIRSANYRKRRGIVLHNHAQCRRIICHGFIRGIRRTERQYRIPARTVRVNGLEPRSSVPSPHVYEIGRRQPQIRWRRFDLRSGIIPDSQPVVGRGKRFGFGQIAGRQDKSRISVMIVRIYRHKRRSAVGQQIIFRNGQIGASREYICGGKSDMGCGDNSRGRKNEFRFHFSILRNEPQLCQDFSHNT